jgi:hypothetical protein
MAGAHSRSDRFNRGTCRGAGESSVPGFLAVHVLRIEGRMTKRFILTLGAVTASVLAAITPPDAQQSQTEPAVIPVTPALADIMSTTQLRHLKLAYSGKVQNWPLAGYELGLIQQSFDSAARNYPELKGIPLAQLIKQESEPPLGELRRAIDTRSSDGFVKAFRKLTEACNRCHQTAGVGFIVIRIPTASPFSNQLFPPPDTR